jgi:hypothetical protein
MVLLENIISVVGYSPPLSFNHSFSKDITNLSFTTSAVVQGLKNWGRDKKFDKVLG